MSYSWTTSHRGSSEQLDAAPRRTPDACTCGHDKAVHGHYRPGTDCGSCGPSGCPRFHRPGVLQRLLARLNSP
ncbi:hypothetical protein ACU61A_15890 [Pseudonocardia sichuanensis]